MGFDFMSAFNALLLLWGAVWIPIFLVLIIAVFLGLYNPHDEEKRRKWQKGTWVAFFAILIFYLIILSRNHVGLN